MLQISNIYTCFCFSLPGNILSPVSGFLDTGLLDAQDREIAQYILTLKYLY
ncbi:hypothetical protein MmTuc01_0459 [Methanosarcina mazei Tuc01]|uniref:Uncharacterized protein n=1 Tax=Methanosarcina mazei Tuc01 TaxID=1236903 RepID=M1Q6X5_METMZ|nr:hypothetical protein MmTuc01_0459 [Methanosarcina mazei Tuc01]